MSTSILEEVVRHLASKGEHRPLVTLVETWATQGEPTIAARLALSRSLLSLRAVDRAWARIRDLVEAPEPNLAALEIAAEMFLLRGWPNQARKVISRGLALEPAHLALNALERRAEEPPTTLEESTIDGDGTSISDLVRIAEHYLAKGSIVRARALLERVRRKMATHPRANELLWAMDGMFVTNESLATLCERWGPQDTETSLLDRQDASDEPEHTESARVDEPKTDEEEEDAFPKLFRNQPAKASVVTDDPMTTAPMSPDRALTARVNPSRRVAPLRSSEANSANDFDTNEQTAITSMAALVELHAAALQEATDAGEDTQIARVMSKRGIEQVSGVVHLNPSAVDAKFDLGEYRREMGMTGPGIDSDFGGPEDEDDSVVILTGQEHDDAPETSESGRLNLDHVLLQEEARAKAKHASVEESWVVALPRPPEDSTPAPLAARSAEARPASPGQTAKPTQPTAPALDVTAELLPQSLSSWVSSHMARDRMFTRYPLFESSDTLISWPYWMAALSTVLMLFVVVFVMMCIIVTVLQPEILR